MARIIRSIILILSGVLSVLLVEAQFYGPVDIHLAKYGHVTGENIIGKIYTPHEGFNGRSVGIALADNFRRKALFDYRAPFSNQVSSFSIEVPQSTPSGIYQLVVYNPFDLTIFGIQEIAVMNLTDQRAPFQETNYHVILKQNQSHTQKLVEGLPNELEVRVKDDNNAPIPFYGFINEDVQGVDTRLLDLPLSASNSVEFIPKSSAHYILKLFTSDSIYLGPTTLGVRNQGSVFHYRGWNDGHNFDFIHKRSAGFRYKLHLSSYTLDTTLAIQPGNIRLDPSIKDFGWAKIEIRNSSNVPIHEYKLFDEAAGQLTISMIPDKAVYGRGELVTLDITVTTAEGQLIEAPISLSIGIVDTELDRPNSAADAKRPAEPLFIPESLSATQIKSIPKKGFIKGQLLNNCNPSLTYQRPIIMTSPGNRRGISGIYTDTLGYFYFQIPETSVDYSYYFQLHNEQESERGTFSIKIDDAYQVVDKLPRAFSNGLTRAHNQMLRFNTVRIKTDSIYNAEAVLQKFKQSKETNFYDPVTYEKYDFKYELDDYINVASMRTVIQEIIPYARYRRKRITLYSHDDKHMWIRPALKLLDGIPFLDDSFINDYEPNKIDRIEILTSFDSRKKIGFTAENGIIAFYTRSQRNELQHQIPSYKIAPVLPEVFERKPLAQGKRLLDLRQLIYWNNNVELIEGRGKIVFRLTDNATTFEVTAKALAGTQISQQKLLINTSK